MLTSEIEAAALGVLHEAGLLVESIAWDSGLQRIPVDGGKRGNKAGAYVAFSDTPVSIWWQNFRAGDSGTWTAKKQSEFSQAECEAFARRMEWSRKTREEEQALAYAKAAERAKAIYNAAAPCAEHEYLSTKRVKSVPGLKVHKNGVLVVPMHDENCKLVSLQFINRESGKIFLKSGRKRGCYFLIAGKDSSKPLLVCEGLATGLSLHECLGLPVLVAFDAGNLQPVAELARRKFPKREIVLCADNDCEGEPNTGVVAATKAALTVCGSLAIPHHEGRKVDWNDIHQLMEANHGS